MNARVHSGLLQGIEAVRCEVEVDCDETAIARETIVGLPDAAVRESLERVRSALGNSGYPFPGGRVLINLAPADLKKEGPVYDLPIAVGLLLIEGVVRDRGEVGGSTETSDDRLDPRRVLIAGELALDGRVRPVKGAIALAALAADLGMAAVICPKENAAEAAVVGGVRGVPVYGVRTLVEVVGLLSGHLDMEPEPPVDVAGMLGSARATVDFAEVKGQEAVKRALVVAAAGGHNVLMLGPAGSGKTMMAKALPGILPSLTPAEAIELTRIYSAAGQLPAGAGLVSTRPVRSPHHTASSAAIVGGGIVPRAGEISLAHHGVLFLDELPEFGRGVLETLRQPMEDHVVTIARSRETVRFPADFMLVAAMNPTPKGDVAPGEVGRREMERYMGRVSGPMLDRIDLHVEAPAVAYRELRGGAGGRAGMGSAEMRGMVAEARGVMLRRQGESRNARLSGRQLDRFAPLDDAAAALLEQAMTGLGLSARAYDKIRRVARTITDLAGGAEVIGSDAVAEAVQYRLLDRRV